MKTLLLFLFALCFSIVASSQTVETTSYDSQGITIVKTVTKTDTQRIDIEQLTADFDYLESIIQKQANQALKKLDLIDDFNKGIAPTLTGTYNEAFNEAKVKQLWYFYWSGSPSTIYATGLKRELIIE